jgi:hypothetical protein
MAKDVPEEAQIRVADEVRVGELARLRLETGGVERRRGGRHDPSVRRDPEQVSRPPTPTSHANGNRRLRRRQVPARA